MPKLRLSQLRQHPLFPRMIQIIIGLVVLWILYAIFSGTSDGRKSVDMDMEKVLAKEQEAVAKTKPIRPLENAPLFSYQIQSGDNLSSIFVRLGVPYGDMLSVMDTDQNHLTLDTLRPGNTLKIWMDEDQKHLTKLEVEFTIANKVDLSDIGNFST